MTTAAIRCSIDASSLLGDYLDHVAGLGLSGRAIRDWTRIAREFLSRNPDLDAWMALPAVERAAELRSTGASPRDTPAHEESSRGSTGAQATATSNLRTRRARSFHVITSLMDPQSLVAVVCQWSPRRTAT
jgi:hypothetical protein